MDINRVGIQNDVNIQLIDRSTTTGLCVPMSVAPKSKIDQVIKLKKRKKYGNVYDKQI